jgi:GTP-binding protein Era
VSAAPDRTPAGDSEPTRCGFVAIIGAPNAGKSTLVNMLVGAKIAIVTPKVQTTRTRLLGIALHGPAQILLVDTPGIFRPRRRFERAMVKAAWKGASDADEIVLLVDANANPPEPETLDIVAGLKEADRTAILALNKADEAPRQNLLELAQSLGAEGIFPETFMISALTGDGVDDMKAALARRLPEGPWLYPEDQISDAPMRFLAAEAVPAAASGIALRNHGGDRELGGIPGRQPQAQPDHLCAARGAEGNRAGKGRDAHPLGPAGRAVRARGDARAQGASLPVREAARALVRRPGPLSRDGARLRAVMKVRSQKSEVRSQRSEERGAAFLPSPAHSTGEG